MFLMCPWPEEVANSKSALCWKMSGFAWICLPWQKTEPSGLMTFTSSWYLLISWNCCTLPALYPAVLTSPDLLGFQSYGSDAFYVLLLDIVSQSVFSNEGHVSQLWISFCLVLLSCPLCQISGCPPSHGLATFQQTTQGGTVWCWCHGPLSEASWVKSGPWQILDMA